MQTWKKVVKIVLHFNHNENFENGCSNFAVLLFQVVLNVILVVLATAITLGICFLLALVVGTVFHVYTKEYGFSPTETSLPEMPPPETSLPEMSLPETWLPEVSSIETSPPKTESTQPPSPHRKSPWVTITLRRRGDMELQMKHSTDKGTGACPFFRRSNGSLGPVNCRILAGRYVVQRSR